MLDFTPVALGSQRFAYCLAETNKEIIYFSPVSLGKPIF